MHNTLQFLSFLHFSAENHFRRILKVLFLIRFPLPNWRLMMPLFLGIGIGIYFSLPFEPSSLIPITIYILLTGGGCYQLRHHTFGFWWMLGVLFIGIGFFTAQLHTTWYLAPKLHENRTYTISGNIEDIIPLTQGFRLVLGNVSIPHLAKEHTPLHVRLIAKIALPPLNIGEVIHVKANLQTLSPAVIPEGYDFAQVAFFEKIGATGYIYKLLEAPSNTQVPKNVSPWESLLNYRQHFSQHLYTTLGKEAGPIASALSVGMYQFIMPSILEDIRNSGLAHILSVSGMHLSLVAGMIFLLTRALLRYIVIFNEKWAIHKLAALIAMAGSGLYLVISGQQIAAQRAFIMVIIGLTALLLDRRSSPLYAISWAATFILLFTPHSLLHPSFHMSFAAVIALIAAYEKYRILTYRPSSEQPFFHPFFILKKVSIYCLGVFMSSLIAGTATAPFSIYHFHQYANFGALANLIGVPLTSFIIMPCIILTLILYPLGWDFVILPFLKKSITLFILLAGYISHLPGATITIQAMPLSALLCFCGALLCFCLCRTLWSSLALIIVGAMIFLLKPLPDIALSPSAKLYAFYDAKHKQLLVPSKQSSRFIRESWQSYFGTNQSFLFERATFPMVISKEDHFHYLELKKRHILLIFDNPASICHSLKNYLPLTAAMPEYQFDLIVNYSSRLLPDCLKTQQLISQRELTHQGTHLIWLDPIKIKTVYPYQAKRPWQY